MNRLISKFKLFRQVFSQFGYSQVEFQQYFLQKIFGCIVKEQGKISQVLLEKINSIKAIQQLQKVIGIIDLELQSIRGTKQVAYEQNQNSDVIMEKKNNILKNKRKGSKQCREPRKQKIGKAEKNRKKRRSDQDQLVFLKDRTNQISNIFLRPYNPIDPLNAFKIFTQSRDDQQENSQGKEKQQIFQKLLEIQMLSKLLCSASELSLEREENPFLMRC